MATTVEQIKERPDLHVHKDDKELMKCCKTNGKISAPLMEAHGTFVDMGTNAGVRCDVISGPCACGAWHDGDENRYLEVLMLNKMRALFTALYPEMTSEENRTISGLFTRMIHKWLKSDPDKRAAVMEKSKKEILALAMEIKNKTA